METKTATKKILEALEMAKYWSEITEAVVKGAAAGIRITATNVKKVAGK